MQKYSMDFGGSTVDVIRWKGETIVAAQSYERRDVSVGSLAIFIKEQNLSLEGIEEIRVTGGKTHQYASEVNGIPVVRVDEIEAIGRGGAWLLNPNEPVDCLTVSMGTGT
ncbi:MAG: hypothetical protein Q8P27_01255, partial [Candidatus Peregrinibacteria bacterium]|nr:hypothetical protein [Candidatus Peregrinibacteria bacterium]